MNQYTLEYQTARGWIGSAATCRDSIAADTADLAMAIADQRGFLDPGHRYRAIKISEVVEFRYEKPTTGGWVRV